MNNYQLSIISRTKTNKSKITGIPIGPQNQFGLKIGPQNQFHAKPLSRKVALRRLGTFAPLRLCVRLFNARQLE